MVDTDDLQRFITCLIKRLEKAYADLPSEGVLQVLRAVEMAYDDIRGK